MAVTTTQKADRYQNQANTAIVQISTKLTEQGIEIPTKTKAYLKGVGIADPTQQQQILLMAMAIGMPLQAVEVGQNIGTLRTAWGLVEKYGATPGHDFYLVDYNRKSSDPWEKSNYTIVPSVAWLQHSATEWARMNGMSVVLSVEPIFDIEEVNRKIEIFEPNAVLCPGNRGAKARFLVAGGEPTSWQYGFVFWEGFRGVRENGTEYTFKADKNNASNTPGNGPQDKAGRRATRAACRMLTRTLFPLDGQKVDSRLVLNQRRAHALESIERDITKRVKGGQDLLVDHDLAAEAGEAVEQELNAVLSELKDVSYTVTEFTGPAESAEPAKAPAEDPAAALRKVIAIDLDDEAHTALGALMVMPRGATANPTGPGMQKLRDAIGGLAGGDEDTITTDYGQLSRADLVIATLVGAAYGAELPSNPCRRLWDGLSEDTPEGKVNPYVTLVDACLKVIGQWVVDAMRNVVAEGDELEF